MAGHTKCTVKYVFSEEWLDCSRFYKDTVSREFCNGTGVFICLPLPELELQIGICRPKLVKNVTD
jgi:hypothetical protein